jgi:hypothetical protein
MPITLVAPGDRRFSIPDGSLANLARLVEAA